eukprot:sb/3463395/
MQGWRMSMEDAHTTVPVVPGMDKCSFYAVFDGHCGPTIAKYSSENLLMEFLKHPDLSAFVNSGNNTNIDPEAVGKVMKEGFVILDDYMKTVPPWKNGEDQSGSTAVCALVTPTHVICANCGDSRAIFSRQGDLGLVTRDHKPTNDDEKSRIEKAGGSVIMHRVNGSLAVSRALGDYEYKTSTNMPSIEQQVSPLPEIFTLERDNDKDEFLLIACDGIWDVMSNQESIEYIHRELQIRDDLGLICANLLEECLQRGSRDNMSAVLVTFPAAPEVNEEARLKDEEIRDNDKDEFLLIACDGIWDVMSNQESIEYIHRELQIRDDLGLICANLLEECLQRGSRDNMSAVLVTFPAAPEVNEEARLKDEEERRKIAAITEKIEEEVTRLFIENNAVSVAHACGAVDTILESCEPEGGQLRIPRRRIVENKLLDLRENEYSTQASAPIEIERVVCVSSLDMSNINSCYIGRPGGREGRLGGGSDHHQSVTEDESPAATRTKTLAGLVRRWLRRRFQIPDNQTSEDNIDHQKEQNNAVDSNQVNDGNTVETTAASEEKITCKSGSGAPGKSTSNCIVLNAV